MEIQIGDKVRFLDAIGGGIVRRIDTQRQLAYVEDEEGFEVPTTFAQCVVVPQDEQEYRVRTRASQRVVAEKEKGTVKPQQREVANGKKEAKQEDILEVDLHIEALLPNTSMPQNEMLQYQLRIARNTLGTHIRHKGKKLVFIHGKGDGKLKKELHRMLSQQFPTCLFLEASFQKYGSGATMVVIN